jgi:acetyltransferase
MDVLMRVSLMACEIPCIYELDINPVLADAQGAVALDARVVLGPGTLQPDARYSHLAIHPYPVHLESSLSTRDGRTLELRPIRPEDAEAEKRFVSRLSPRSRFLRFHGPLRELTQERLVRYTQIDYDREMALIAVDAESEIRGVARYIRNPDGFSCEFGFAVEDAWQGLGVGSALMDALERCAYQRGLKEIVGLVLEENLGACRLLRKRGYSSKADADDPLVLHYTKSLP